MWDNNTNEGQNKVGTTNTRNRGESLEGKKTIPPRVTEAQRLAISGGRSLLSWFVTSTPKVKNSKLHLTDLIVFSSFTFFESSTVGNHKRIK